MRACLLALLSTVALAAPAMGGCLEELNDVVQKQKSSGPYRVTMAMDGEMPMTITAEVVLPDRFRMSMPQGEAVVIGDKSWMKMGGQWMEIPGMGAQLTGMMKEAELVTAELARNVACGDTTRGGASYRLIEFDTSGEPMGVKTTTHVKIYLDAATGLPAVQEIEGESNGTRSRILQTITYDPAITIEPPQ
jgi:hypothetical protein